eukprot:7380910-Prymnesium_polylepis.1
MQTSAGPSKILRVNRLLGFSGWPLANGVGQPAVCSAVTVGRSVCTSRFALAMSETRKPMTRSSFSRSDALRHHVKRTLGNLADRPPDKCYKPSKIKDETGETLSKDEQGLKLCVNAVCPSPSLCAGMAWIVVRWVVVR